MYEHYNQQTSKSKQEGGSNERRKQERRSEEDDEGVWMCREGRRFPRERERGRNCRAKNIRRRGTGRKEWGRFRVRGKRIEEQQREARA